MDFFYIYEKRRTLESMSSERMVGLGVVMRFLVMSHASPFSILN